MTKPSFRRTRALVDGWLRAVDPNSREAILATLLRKRAEARQAGMEEQEAMLRNQIRWSLPVRKPDEPDA